MSDYNGQRNFTPPPRKKNALDHDKLKLKAPTPDVPGKYANLLWGFHANNPRITVFTGDPDDNTPANGYGKIVASLDTPTFFVFIELLKKTVNSETECKEKIINKNYIFPGGKRSETPVVISDLWVGKDKEGCVFISVTADKRPKIKFIIGPTEFHSWVHGDGTPATKGEVSTLYATGYVNILSAVYANLIVSEYVEKEVKPNNGNNGGNNRYQNNNGNNQNNYQRNNAPARTEPTPVDEDLPF